MIGDNVLIRKNWCRECKGRSQPAHTLSLAYFTNLPLFLTLQRWTHLLPDGHTSEQICSAALLDWLYCLAPILDTAAHAGAKKDPSQVIVSERRHAILRLFHEPQNLFYIVISKEKHLSI